MSWVAFAVGGLIVTLAWRPPNRPRDAHFAGLLGARDLAVQGTPPHRLHLGTLATARWRSSGSLLAAPAGSSMLVVGPTQSGKTSSLVIPALLGWDGPILAASVKDDLVAASIRWRATQGPVWVLDPSHGGGDHSASFDPTAGQLDAHLARRRANRLCSDTEITPGHDAQFWSQLAAKHLAPLLLAANRVDGGLGLVERWVDERAVAEPASILASRGERAALRWLDASMDRDDRQRSSVVATLEAVLAPLSTQGMGVPIDIEEMLAGAGTLYLCAAAHDQRHHRPLFSAVTDELFEAAFRRARSEGGRLRRRLLVILDEAAAIAPLPELDVLASTCSSHGITLVSCFQDLAQIEARWGAKAPTLINNHTTRVLLSGLADRSARPTFEALLGSASRPVRREQATDRRPLVESAELRQLPSHRGIVVYGRLAPVRLALRPWWRMPSLRDRGDHLSAGYASDDGRTARSRGYRRYLHQGHLARWRRDHGADPQDPAACGTPLIGRGGGGPAQESGPRTTQRGGIPRAR